MFTVLIEAQSCVIVCAVTPPINRCHKKEINTTLYEGYLLLLPTQDHEETILLLGVSYTTSKQDSNHTVLLSKPITL